MVQDQDNRVWPSATGALTLTFAFLSRQTEGAGAFASGNPMPGSLAIVFPGGRNDQLTLSAIRETVITHLLNTASFIDWYSPVNQTIEGALRDSLQSLIPGYITTSTTLYVYVDGQFGSVRVS